MLRWVKIHGLHSRTLIQVSHHILRQVIGRNQGMSMALTRIDYWQYIHRQIIDLQVNNSLELERTNSRITRLEKDSDTQINGNEEGPNIVK